MRFRIGVFHSLSYPLILLVTAVLVEAFESLAVAQNYNILYNFGRQLGGDGINPVGSLILSGSTLYGMTSGGGINENGAIFSFDTLSSEEGVLHSFGASGDGTIPLGSLIQLGSTLYGLTTAGGSLNNGTLFSFDTTDDTESVIHSFGASGDGSRPQGSLIQSGSTLYGLTDQGGEGGARSLPSTPLQTSKIRFICSTARPAMDPARKAR